MTKKRRDTINAGLQYLLWPDEKGLLTLPRPSNAPLKEFSLRHWLRSPRVAIVRARSLRSSRYSASSLLLRSSAAAGWKEGVESLFSTWLRSQLIGADFEALSLAEVFAAASAELELDRERVLMILVKRTRSGSEFVSDGEIVTLR